MKKAFFDSGCHLFFILGTPLILFTLVIIVGCRSESEENSVDAPLDRAITEPGLQKHIQTLASDEFEGRMPFTEGEKKTIQYLENAFNTIGLEPGNGDSYFQAVPLVEIAAVPEETMVVEGAGETVELNYREDFVALTRRVTDRVEVGNSELVFCGFGIVAPEYNWNDYKGIDMTGKTAVVLVNDPGFGTSDSALFKGNTMTYYGRWTYKYEEAARQGAEGVIIIHNTAPAGYAWNVVQSSWTGNALYLRSENGNQSRCAFEGWVSQQSARQLLELANIENYLGQARTPGFRPIPMGLAINLKLNVTYKEATSQNVVAKRTGSERPNEYIIYSAHWDHLGVGKPINGDSIYNGALDNASGTAVLLEVANAFSQLEKAPDRTVVFLAVTAEEQGLLGSAYYAENPIYPVNQTVANINMDGIHFRGSMKDLTIVGYGQSELDDYAEAVAREQDRYVIPDPNAEKGYFFRSDHFSFAKVGIPALYASGEYEQAEQGVEWTQAKMEEWTQRDYHQPSDEYNESEWNLAGMVQDAHLLFKVGYRISNEETFPRWKEGSEFKAIREESLSSP
ncbi:M28 family metallopeptidase [Tunicatimonas pelagia]|uniref:M28 family metallopeptidase n=1 Tax=Tunicatimonas pelagia TaxID=931531 RepID=UPI002664F191|nr:M28 family metallopeptidase [Tunicatimonas pelagia]WKN44399.1 M28 family metallopeptidase [Tunicatimonas pelagia]